MAEQKLQGGSLKRELGLLDAVLLSVGGMVGAAIFIFPGSTGQLVGPASILAWMTAGLLMVVIALLYTELSLAFPEAGGPAVFPYKTLGPYPLIRSFASYLEGVSYSIGWAFAITVSALAIADYVAIIVPGTGGYTVGIAVTAIALSLLVNLIGVDMTSRTNLIFSAILLAVLVTFIGLGLSSIEPTNYQPFFTSNPVKFFAAIQIAITAYGAWTAIPSAAEEIRNPERTIPRAIIISLLVAAVLYGGVVAVVHGHVPATEFVEGRPVMAAPLGTAAQSFGGSIFQTHLLPVAAITAIFTTMLVGMLSAGRVLLALGRNNTLPRLFASVDERFRVPWVGLAAVTLLAAGFAAVPQYFYEVLVVASLVGTGVPYAINILSFIGLRWYRQDVTPSFRVPGGYILPVAAFVVLGIAIIGLGTTEVVWSLGALGMITAYFFIRYLRHPEIVKKRETEV